MTPDPTDARNEARLSRAAFLRGLAALTLPLHALTPAYPLGESINAGADSQQPRPNILWIIAEDLAPDLGCYGNPYARTPNLDRLATEGVRFARAFAVAPVESPSRSGLFTGCWPIALGTHNHRSRAVPAELPVGGKERGAGVARVFSEYLRAAGYWCANNAKTDYNFPVPRTAWDRNDNAVTWRDRPDPNQPFFMVLHLGVTHESNLRLSGEDFAEAIRGLPEDRKHDPAKAPIPPYLPNTPVVRRDIARYHDLLSRADLEVGRILADLAADSLTERTLVLFTSDHGPGLPRGQRFCYDAGIHVPLIVRWPGVLEPGQEREEIISHIDLAPTMLAAAKALPLPRALQGQAAFGPIASSPAGNPTGKKPTPRVYAFASRDRVDEVTDTIRAVRDHRYLYIRNDRPEVPYAAYIEYAEAGPSMQELRRLRSEEFIILGRGESPNLLTPTQRLFLAPRKPEEELYDTQADPFCIRNLAADPKLRKDRDRLRSALENWRDEMGDLGRQPEDRLREQKWMPGGAYPQCAPPKIEVDQSATGLIIVLSSPTPGASLAYSTDLPDASWALYIAPLAVTKAELAAAVKAHGGITLRVVASRAGWNDSDEISVRIDGK